MVLVSGLVVGLVVLMLVAAGVWFRYGSESVVLWFLVGGTGSLGLNAVSKNFLLKLMLGGWCFWFLGFCFLFSGIGLSSFLGGFSFTRKGVCCFVCVWFLVSGTFVDGIVLSSGRLLSGIVLVWSSFLVFLQLVTGVWFWWFGFCSVWSTFVIIFFHISGNLVGFLVCLVRSGIVECVSGFWAGVGCRFWFFWLLVILSMV